LDNKTFFNSFKYRCCLGFNFSPGALFHRETVGQRHRETVGRRHSEMKAAAKCSLLLEVLDGEEIK
jgi:hypothetical protein